MLKFLYFVAGCVVVVFIAKYLFDTVQTYIKFKYENKKKDEEDEYR